MIGSPSSSVPSVPSSGNKWEHRNPLRLRLVPSVPCVPISFKICMDDADPLYAPAAPRAGNKTGNTRNIILRPLGIATPIESRTAHGIVSQPRAFKLRATRFLSICVHCAFGFSRHRDKTSETDTLGRFSIQRPWAPPTDRLHSDPLVLRLPLPPVLRFPTIRENRSRCGKRLSANGTAADLVMVKKPDCRLSKSGRQRLLCPASNLRVPGRLLQPPCPGVAPFPGHSSV